MRDIDTRRPRARLKHVVIAIVAVLAAAALVLNYYLW